MKDGPRSLCAINLWLEVFGDRWTLLIIRDLAYEDKHHFRELLRSEEGISPNVLSDRLQLLLDEGVIAKSDDESHKQKVFYELTEKGEALLPILSEIGEWGLEYLPVSDEYRERAVHGQ